MFRTALLIPLMTLAACAATTASTSSGRWVDLSHDLAEDSVFWPTAEGFKHVVASYGPTPGGWFYSSYNLQLSEHGGTHLDAPIHFAEGKQTTDQIPLERLIGPAAVIDVSAASAANPDYRFTVGDVLAWEQKNGRLPDGAAGLSGLWLGCPKGAQKDDFRPIAPPFVHLESSAGYHFRHIGLPMGPA